MSAVFITFANDNSKPKDQQNELMKHFTLLILLAATMAGTARADNGLKPRLVVCTDIAPADVEPDDMESMVRLMAYADCFEIEALITSVGWKYLQRVIEAYRKDVNNLMKRSAQQGFLPMEQENGSQKMGYWPSADYLKGRAVMGSQRGGIKVIGEDNDSPGSNLLIRLADEQDERPIYVAAWGGANTLAQAIWRVKQTRTAEELKKFVSKFRIYTITDQDMQYNMRMDRAYSSHQCCLRTICSSFGMKAPGRNSVNWESNIGRSMLAIFRAKARWARNILTISGALKATPQVSST